MIDFVYIIIIALLVVIGWVFLFMKFNILDKPWPDIIPPRKPVPTLQWIFLYMWVLFSILLVFPDYLQNIEIIVFFLLWFIILIFWVIDEIKWISPMIRVVIQLLLGFIAFYFAWVGIESINLPILWQIEFPFVVAAILTIIWFVWFMNAINWFDGVNSLASWVSSIGFLTIILLIYLVVFPHYQDITQETKQMLEMVANISFIFLIFSLLYTFVEFKPFWLLRDVGVMFLWFALAYLALLWGAKIWTILVAISLAFFDAIWVFLNRILVMKKNPLKWDYTHLHHRLMRLGWSRNEVRVFVWGWSLFFMTIIILLWADRLWKVVIFLFMFLVFFWVNYYLFWIKGLPYEFIKKEKK